MHVSILHFQFSIFNHFNSNIMEKFNKLKQIIASTEEDAAKFFEKDNAAAGTRVRKALQEIKELAHELRLDIQAAKNSKEA